MTKLSRVASLTALVGAAAVSQALFYNSGVQIHPHLPKIAYGSVDSKFLVRKTAGAGWDLNNWWNPFVVIPSPEGFGAVWIGDDTQLGPSAFTRSFASRWLSPFTMLTYSQRARGVGVDQGIHPDDQGIYEYVYSFYLSSSEAALLNSTGITGRWSSDNGSRVLWNSTEISSIDIERAFQQWTPFEMTGGFNAGLNTLTFEVRNFAIQDMSNPTGLRVEFTNLPAGVPAVPEPFTMALGAGALALAAARKRRKAKK